MTKQEKCPTFLIEDTPASEDAFGPHQRIADAIADLIESSEAGGKVIGLEGGWGAGKSTVVGFLFKRFSKNDNHTAISFDAWAHEGDPLRRTYLETLIQELRATKWVDDATWEKRREEIAHRRRETTTRITPKPTKLGVVLAVSILLVPLGTAFLSAGLRAGVTFGGELLPNWVFIVGLLLALSPFWVLLVNFIRILCTRNSKKADSQVDESKHESEAIPSEWAFLFSRAINETRSETVESPNPTSIEFEDYFTKLMREALGTFNERRCLLVLDNLDRVDPENALAIWSTLQTFLQDRSHRKEGWFRRIWVVVPFDPGGLRKLWDKGSPGEDSTTPTGVNESSASDSFLDKSFQVRFHVPPPVLSDWKAYVYRLVTEALPEHGVEDRHWIYRFFDHCRTRTGEPPTPRELKLYVNQIGAVHRQWEHTFPVQHVAYYVLYRRAGKSIIERLRKEAGFPSEQDTAFLGENLRRNLAGLAFNVEPDKGIELLLAEPIYQALADGDSTKLSLLEESNPDGFWAVLEIVATSKLHDAGEGFCTSDVELYLAIIEGAKEGLSGFANWCKSGLEHLPKDKWAAQFSGDFSCFRLMLALADQEQTPELKTGFSDALANHAQSVCSGDQIPGL
ncbi:P-loop NTPase fold protein [Lignipirellula cremea]|uniref:KAP family P-loop domain protein n=1 Tax=Lignipirellula cremea TaxID=2528010 RepID=A0A518DQI0_9BACT|nr:P-loop NTPase fold protein [Lignipirellula cremea]QDU94100.1 KAP family P-loop domain protein [Lignipirellula cremea]